MHRWLKYLERMAGSGRFWAVFVTLAFLVPTARALWTPPPPALPALGQLPPFQFQNQYSQTFGSEQLKGKVWVANFIFTRCPTVCPVFTEKMAMLQDRFRNLGPAIHLVSFSVDPEYDTPPVLLAYAQKHQASPRMWTFLTGQPEQIRQTVVDGLKISLGKEKPDGDFMSIFHGTHFVLVDGRGQIRGYYASADPDSVEKLVRDAGLLVNRGR